MDSTQLLNLLAADPRVSAFLHQSIAREPCAAIIVLNPMLNIDPRPFIDHVILKHGWYRSREVAMGPRTQHYLESVVQPIVAVPRVLFHATHKTNRESIAANGLIPRPGGATWTQRRYSPDRTHFARTLADALIYIESHVTQTTASAGLTALGAAKLDEWDVYLVCHGGAPFRADVEMDRAVWTDIRIAPHRLWRRRRKLG